MELPFGAEVNLAAGEEARIEAALAALVKDPHAPSELTVRLSLFVFREYPKHITVGSDKDGNPIVKVAQNADEEKALLASVVIPTPPAPIEPPPPAPPQPPAQPESAATEPSVAAKPEGGE
jgi:hypothetical protein